MLNSVEKLSNSHVFSLFIHKGLWLIITYFELRLEFTQFKET